MHQLAKIWAPYLFILCSEFLSLLIKSNPHPGIEIKINNKAPKISHLLFADDTLLFGTASTKTAGELAGILRRYCELSGEAVNSLKSNILFGPKVPASAKRAILHMLSQRPTNSLSYLGITLRPGKIKIADFNYVLDKMTCKNRSWGHMHLSMAGRAALIKSSLSTLPAWPSFGMGGGRKGAALCTLPSGRKFVCPKTAVAWVLKIYIYGEEF
ncbi:hypothetical protein KSP39_PZI014256 [Platanthera zijinensis]|uniref:Reverse transcriptase domain-containing protein n=1 Tax=Platanthera zijinensis TaxID=2320716 RepID=A0AAP0BAQ6_9ASPA